MSILLHHSSESAAGRVSEAGAQQAAGIASDQLHDKSLLEHLPASLPGLQFNLNRHFDPTPGRWVSDEPVGCAIGDGNVTRYRR
jgi:hypothetical protein